MSSEVCCLEREEHPLFHVMHNYLLLRGGDIPMLFKPISLPSLLGTNHCCASVSHLKSWSCILGSDFKFFVCIKDGDGKQLLILNALHWQHKEKLYRPKRNFRNRSQ